MISIDNLTFDYPTKRALTEVSCTIAAGSVTALVGPNGAGKTTLMRCLAGLDQPVTGAVAVDGVDVLAKPRLAHRHIGYLRDLFGLYDELSVRRCLAFHAAAFGVDRAERPARIAWAAEALGLTDRLGEKAGRLSRGLRQRLAIAQVVIHKPKVLLLDEPASGLDPEARMELSRFIVNLNGEGMTILVSSHILAELEDYSTDVLIVSGGRIVDHQHLHDRAGEGLSGRSAWLALRFVGETTAASVEASLRRQDQVRDVLPDGDMVRFRFVGTAEERARLLAALVADGIAVASFGEARDLVQDAYLKSVRRAAAPAAPEASP
ncbi:MAG: ABC transporter ATP-binding protein [Azospirillaceae bacterium]